MDIASCFTWSSFACLSHGQATLENGFSVNASGIVENLAEESIVAQRIVHDRNCLVVGVPLFKELLTSVRCSHRAYVTAMETKKAESDKAEKMKELRTEIQELTKRKNFVKVQWPI